MATFLKLRDKKKVGLEEVFGTLWEYADEGWSIAAPVVSELIDRTTPDSRIDDQYLVGLARACLAGLIQTPKEEDARDYLAVLRHLVERFSRERVYNLLNI